jgi:hypothetical protein
MVRSNRNHGRRATASLSAVAWVVLSLAASGPLWAQSGSTFEIEWSTFNAGGTPASEATPSSASFRLSLQAIGSEVVAHGLSGPSFEADVGAVSAYAPPTEVRNLRFVTDTQTLVWAAERSVGSYNLYRGTLEGLGGSGFGQCLRPGIVGASTVDPERPAADQGFFYLVTAVNRLGEEGTKGPQGDGVTERQGTTCP